MISTEAVNVTVDPGDIMEAMEGYLLLFAYLIYIPPNQKLSTYYWMF